MTAFARGRKRGFFADSAAGPFRLLGLLNNFLEFLYPFTVLTVKLCEVFIHFCPMGRPRWPDTPHGNSRYYSPCPCFLYGDA